MDRRTKTKVAALAALALLFAVALGASGALAVSRALSDDDVRVAEHREHVELPALGGLRQLPLWIAGFGAVLGAAADYLGIDEEELRARLQNETLAEIAEDEGTSVDGLVDALVDARSDAIDEAVERGHLDEEWADELKEGLEDRVRGLVEGELRFAPFALRFDDDWPGGFPFPWDAPPGPRGPRA